MTYRVILGSDTIEATENYATALAAGSDGPGAYLARLLPNGTEHPSATDLIGLLLRTKRPQIFAESAVKGDGTDWSATELHILGDISIATDVNVFDDGEHTSPTLHDPPFSATLVFTCGALFANGYSHTPPDLDEVAPDGKLDQNAYNVLYARRLAPVFAYIQSHAASLNCSALVTVPGLGCGQFAGPFQRRLGPLLQTALAHMLAANAADLDRIKTVIYDPYSECTDHTETIGSIDFRVRPLTLSRNPHPQLCRPESYAEPGDEFDECRLYSLVAWDQVSWPGNDFYAGARTTDDGVKAAATSSMYAMTNVQGVYNATRCAYEPPATYRSWEDCVDQNNLALELGEPFIHPQDSA